jgi:prepilin-type N-terminal cleavage/methylation domain-containing protein
MRLKNESGFTLIELLVASFLFLILSTVFYQVMLSGTGTTKKSQSIISISEEGRLGLNRMIRETRGATKLIAASENSYQIEIDPDGAGSDPPEYYSFFLDATTSEIKLKYEAILGGPSIEDVLVAGVSPVTGRTGVFTYSSHLLRYDVTGGAGGIPDGVATWQELDSAGCGPQYAPVGDCDTPPKLDAEIPYLSNVDYAFTLRNGDAVSDFFSQAYIRATARDF